MKKSTGILLFVVFIFIIMVLNSKKTEHFLGFVCDLVDQSHGRCTLKNVYMNPGKYGGYDDQYPSERQLGPQNVDSFSNACSRFKYNDIDCIGALGEDGVKVQDQTYRHLISDPASENYGQIIEKQLEPAPGEDDNLCIMSKGLQPA